jgi:hypothetical protein
MTTPAPRTADATPETVPDTLICAVCDLSGGPFEDEEEAAYLIGLHNDLHHGGSGAPVPAPSVDPVTSVAATGREGRPESQGRA